MRPTSLVSTTGELALLVGIAARVQNSIFLL